MKEPTIYLIKFSKKNPMFLCHVVKSVLTVQNVK